MANSKKKSTRDDEIDVTKDAEIARQRRIEMYNKATPEQRKQMAIEWSRAFNQNPDPVEMRKKMAAANAKKKAAAKTKKK